MSQAASQAIAVTRALDRVMRKDRGRLLSALIARLGDFQLAEEALQDALAVAVQDWAEKGPPRSEMGWLLRVAHRKAIDRLRHARRQGRLGASLATITPDEAMPEPDIVPDERLRLIFTCCHPAIDQKSRVALTLRCLGGLSTRQIARVFLDAEPTMGQRLSRAKAKIAGAGIPFVVPGPEDWDARLNSVLTVIYLIFTTGYAQGLTIGESEDLCQEAVFLARLLVQLRPDQAESEGLLALILMIHSRRAARVGADGAAVPLDEQDCALWDTALLSEGQALLDRAMLRRAPGPFQIKAALQALHSEGSRNGQTDWQQILLLYMALLRWEDTPVVRLNLAVVRAEIGDVGRALTDIETLGDQLSAYQPFHAARADLLARLGRGAEASMAYDRAIQLTSNPAERLFLCKRQATLPR